MKSEKAPTKHKLKSNATRAALLEAAQAIFARDGYERAQIDEIAKESGRTRGAVYAQYGTKEQLFFALQEQRMEAIETQMRTALGESGGTSTERVEALRKLYASLDDADPAVLDLELKLYAVRNPTCQDEWRNRYKSMYRQDEFEEIFGLHSQAGGSRISSRVLALVSLKSALILSMRFMPDDLTRKETSLLLREVFDGLFPTARKSPSAVNKRKPKTPLRAKRKSQ